MSLGILARAARFDDRVAIRDDDGEHSYAELLDAARAVARTLRGERADLEGARVAYLLPPGFGHVAAQWGIWKAGGVAVPLAMSYPAPELGRLLADARPTHLLIDHELTERAGEALQGARAEARAGGAAAAPRINTVVLGPTPGRIAGAAARPVARRDVVAEEGGRSSDEGAETHPDGGRDALIVYTSGTTGRPKGVVSTHANLAAQITTLVDAWGWSDADSILHVLPLHHVHGIVNALCCALWSGATCRFCPPDPVRIWEAMAASQATVFMAVPTIYRRLVDAWDAADDDTRERWSAGAEALRLMVSGSAALPVETFARWRQISGHTLLERYGMTEIGMALSNPLRGDRRPGTVGQPLGGVEARLVDDHGDEVNDGEQGEIQVRGPQVFREYWDRPQETGAAFTRDGWFRTGDEAVVEDGYWRIAGRRSVDIIKTGGYKVSALEVEAALREHPEIEDAAVVGVADDQWGERICAAIVRRTDGGADEDEIRAWCKARLAPYKVPKQLVTVVRLPRNALGKVIKPELRPMFFESEV